MLSNCSRWKGKVNSNIIRKTHNVKVCILLSKEELINQCKSQEMWHSWYSPDLGLLVFATGRVSFCSAARNLKRVSNSENKQGQSSALVPIEH